MIPPAIGAAALTFLLAACSANVATQAIEPQATTICSLDGMTLNDFPGPKAQIVYDGGDADFFCDTVEMFSAYLQPEQQRRVVGIFTQDMGQAAWDQPRGHWIDAKSAFYVLGSRKSGSMGPTLGAFRTEADAQEFAKAHGGKVLAFAQVTPDMVVADSAAARDGRM